MMLFVKKLYKRKKIIACLVLLLCLNFFLNEKIFSEEVPVIGESELANKADSTDESASSDGEKIKALEKKKTNEDFFIKFEEKYLIEPKRDLFSKPEIISALKASPLHGPFLTLQSYDLKKLKVKGILWNVENPYAIIKTPDNQIKKVGLGDKMGKDNGYVAAIREKEVVVMESYEEANGSIYTTPRILTLTK